MKISEFPLPSAAVAPGTVFSWEKAPVRELSAFELLQKRAMIPKDDVERALLLCCGGFAGVAADKEIFRNRMTPGVRNGFLVNLAGEIPCCDPAFRIWKCSVSGTGDEKYCCGKISQITGNIPLPGWLRISSAVMGRDIVIAALKIAEERETIHPVSGTEATQNRLLLEATVYCGS